MSPVCALFEDALVLICALPPSSPDTVNKNFLYLLYLCLPTIIQQKMEANTYIRPVQPLPTLCVCLCFTLTCPFAYFIIYRPISKIFSDPVCAFLSNLFEPVCVFYFTLFCLPLFRSNLYFRLSPVHRPVAVSTLFCCRPLALLDYAVVLLFASVCFFCCSACLSALFDSVYILFLFCMPPFFSDSYFRLSPAHRPVAVSASFSCHPPVLLDPPSYSAALPAYLCCSIQLHLPVSAVRLCLFLLALLMLCIISHNIVC